MSTSHHSFVMDKWLRVSILTTVILYCFLAPLLFVPGWLGSIYDFPKWLITWVVAAIILAGTAVLWIKNRQIILPAKKFTLPLTIFMVVIIVSMIASPAHIVTSLMGKGGLLIAWTVIAWLAPLFLTKESLPYILYGLISSSFLVGWLEILAYFGILGKIVPESILSAQTFSPLGSPFTLATFLAIVLPMTILIAFNSKEMAQKVLLSVVAGIQAIALVFAILLLLPGQLASPKFLPFSSGWSIAVDQLKSSQTALLGVGPDNFSTAFTRFRPANLNATDIWFLRFGNSSNEWLTMFTTVGVLGLVAYLAILLILSKTAYEKRETPTAFYALTGLILVILQMTIFPANFSSLLLLFILGTIIISLSDEPLIQIKNSLGVWTSSGILLVVSAISLFSTSRAALAESAFGDSLRQAAANKGTETYYAQIKALQLNPFVYRYRVTYANTNLALANSLASKKDLSDEEKKQVTQLVSQSIREAQRAMRLDPLNSSSWVNLANIYRQLINFAKGADQWAVITYIQAIRLDSTNPVLRIDFGGLLLALNQVEDAITQYKQAIALKRDYANAYYNLAYAYQKNEQYPLAAAALQNVLRLVKSDSEDYKKAEEDLKKIQEKLPASALTATGSAQPSTADKLSKPQALPSSKPAGKVEFSEEEEKELAPPKLELETNEEEKEATQSATVESSPTPSPSTSPSPSPEAGN